MQSSTKKTPFEMLYGVTATLPIQLDIPTQPDVQQPGVQQPGVQRSGVQLSGARSATLASLKTVKTASGQTVLVLGKRTEGTSHFIVYCYFNWQISAVR